MNYYIVHESGLVQRVGRFNGPAAAERAAQRKWGQCVFLRPHKRNPGKAHACFTDSERGTSMKLTEETCNELYAACKAAQGQCLTMGAYLKPPFKGHMEIP